MEKIPTLAINEDSRALSTFSAGPQHFDSDFKAYKFERLRPSQGFREFTDLICSIKKYFNLTINQYDAQREIAIHS